MIIGTVINSRYDVKMLIGDGGMANVYLAYDRTEKQHVAIKMLRYELSKDETFIKRFKRESSQVLPLNHPNIVKINDIGDYQQQPFIVMEYVNGKTLKDYLRENGAVSSELAIQIMKQIVSGMRYAHENNIIHRDLKTQNIMITEDYVVKIMDFGIALSSNEADMTQTNTIMGSVHYLAPELARGSLATERSDIYAMGIILYELLTGDVPFKGEGAVNIALQHLEAKMPSIKEVNETLPNSLDNVIQKATAKRPLNRYATIVELEIDLLTALDEERLVEPLRETEEALNLEQTIVMSNLEEEVSKEMAKKEDVNEPRVSKQKRRHPFSFVNTTMLILYTVFLLVGTGILSIVFLSPADQLVEEVFVPEIQGLTIEEGREQLKTSGLSNERIIYIVDETIEEGQILKTSPEVGRRVKIDTEVTFYVARSESSKGEE